MKTCLILAGDDPVDFLHAFPLFYGLKKKFPKRRIVLAAAQRLKTLSYQGLIDQFIVLPAQISESSSLSQLLWAESCVAKVKASVEDFASVESFALLSVADWAPWIQWRLRCAVRNGWENEVGSFLLNGQKLAHPKVQKKRLSDIYWHASAGTSLSGPPFWSEPASDPFDAPHAGEVQSFPLDRTWITSAVVSPPDDPYWVLAPGSESETQQWPWERYLELAREVHARTGLRGVLVGMPQDALQAQRISSDPSAGLLGQVALGGWIDYSQVIGKAQFVISGNSPFAQIALFLGRYTHLVWGADDPQWRLPVGPGRSQMSFFPAPCWPCSLSVCPQTGEQKLRCLRDLSVRNVVDDLWKGLQRYLPHLLVNPVGGTTSQESYDSL